MRNSDLMFPLFVKSKSQNSLVGHFIMIFCPVFRVEASYLPLAKHFLPVFFDALLPSQVRIWLLCVQNIEIAPALLVVRIVFVPEGS